MLSSYVSYTCMGSSKGAVRKKAICGLGEADLLLAFSKTMGDSRYEKV